ncbi:ABC transporter substrate-binding protein [Microvirga guangxiensis]|uniref:Amino acid/amide ABC transporter substrate-binding protein, HAAT family (TC 3.A.1.4.-) n=1 Tax=Microvirga guangxiensis TaxID=549386 RepID=A0A1G5KZS7_9HYPH|nr:ABC transporter substrate-binding protein [Microvirga guangxiensis]SCZ06125.1 amino acid/amide ABC transporter substrate-binding protein, HAAT family (TC 3.A.1.4.-) [Microvirga guangxiensis]
MKFKALYLGGVLTAALSAATLTGAAWAADKPAELKIGITTYSSGSASVFGVPARHAAEILAEEINAKGGVNGVPLKLYFIDEGAGLETLMTEYRRLVEDEGVEVTFASISSGVCNKMAPLAEDLEVVNFMWDCGTQRILEDDKYDYVFRTQANATPEVLAPLAYLLKANPDFKTIAVVNQDYAWGRDSWEIFSNALKIQRPDVKVVAELFPAFGAADFSTEVSRLQALKPDVILSTSWGGDLDTFVRQAKQRGLFETSKFVLPLAESSLQRLGDDLPEGVIVGARGDHYFLHPEMRDKEKFKTFNEKFKARTGEYPIYSAAHMVQAFAALEAVYDKAIKANGGEWPTKEQVAEAMVGLEFQGLGRPLVIREDGQAVEAQLVGTTAKRDGYNFKVIDKMELYDGKDLMAPVGENSLKWIAKFKPDFLSKVPSTSFSHK